MARGLFLRPPAWWGGLSFPTQPPHVHRCVCTLRSAPSPHGGDPEAFRKATLTPLWSPVLRHLVEHGVCSAHVKAGWLAGREHPRDQLLAQKPLF